MSPCSLASVTGLDNSALGQGAKGVSVLQLARGPGSLRAESLPEDGGDCLGLSCTCFCRECPHRPCSSILEPICVGAVQWLLEFGFLLVWGLFAHLCLIFNQQVCNTAGLTLLFRTFEADVEP